MAAGTRDAPDAAEGMAPPPAPGRFSIRPGAPLLGGMVGIEWFFTSLSIEIGIFIFDIATRQDDVSIGFLYILPTLLGFLVKERVLQAAIVVSAVGLIIAGCLIPLPVRDDLLVFFANRVMSVVTVVITGVMVYYRVRLEQTLAEALAREKSASATQRAFVSMVSHEFRTPLTIIDAEAYRLTRIKDTISPDDIEKRAKSIRSSVTRMINLIEGVLYSARAQENKIVCNIERVNLRSLVRLVCHEQGRVASGYQIECDIADLPAMIKGDGNLLTYVFDNLVQNAIKYSPEGTTIRVVGRLDGNRAVVEVHDQGIGVPADDLPKLFEPYFRARNASGMPGSGVGLYIVRTFVGLHGGEVVVESTLGQGSVFTVMLPVAGPR